jgi:hypothetical protein
MGYEVWKGLTRSGAMGPRPPFAILTMSAPELGWRSIPLVSRLPSASHRPVYPRLAAASSDSAGAAAPGLTRKRPSTPLLNEV